MLKQASIKLGTWIARFSPWIIVVALIATCAAGLFFAIRVNEIGLNSSEPPIVGGCFWLLKYSIIAAQSFEHRSVEKRGILKN